jgi:phosphoribosyl 1,2-cyclic phosphate phosphodiesterase
MRLLVLGSGGNTPIPTPTCSCTVCEQARESGPPYSRGGNSLYLPDIGAMTDAPEFAFRALNREDIEDLDYIFLTHWHPDHINGLRLAQSRDTTAHDGLLEAIAAGGPTLVTTETVYERTLDSFGQLSHFRQQGFLDVEFPDDGPFTVGDTTVRSIPYALEDEELDATAFEITRGDETVLIASDDARYLDESALPESIDLAAFECGMFERDPDRTLLTEVEHFTARSHDDFAALAEQDSYDGIEFAHDGLEIEL